MREAICTNAFKQFIPNPLNSRFLSGANDIVEVGTENRERAGWLGSWENTIKAHIPPSGVPVQQDGQWLASSSPSPGQWMWRKNERFCGTSQLFSELFVSTAFINIVKGAFYKYYSVNIPSTIKMSAATPPKVTFIWLHRWHHPTVSPAVPYHSEVSGTFSSLPGSLGLP